MKTFMAFFQTIVLLLLCMTVNSQSAGAAEQTPIRAGDVAPDFTLEDQNRNKIKLSQSHGKSAVVLVFYRGYW